MSTWRELESQRLQLEETVTKLRNSLQHWRTWDAEYEGLKEELTRSDEVQTEQDCDHINQELGGELVNQQEIHELFDVGKGQLRPNHQVASLVERRQDYVQRNIETISNQLRTAEGRLEQIDEAQNQEGDHATPELPITEIFEELDEAGNVISTKVSQPESATSQIVDTLRKAGLTDLDGLGKKDPIQAPKVADAEMHSVEERMATKLTPSTFSRVKQEPAKALQTEEGEAPPIATKKSVKFADNVEEFPTRPVNPSTNAGTATATPDASLVSGSFGSHERVIELDDDDDMIGATPIIPEDESPEDARMRREMLQYGLNEVGSVVAELDLDEDFSDDDDDDDDLDLDDEASNSEVSGDEDEHGRSLRKGVTKNYREQMLELEEKLMARMLENVGPEPDETSPFIDPEELRKLVVRGDDEMPSSKAGASSTKGVRFADELDIAEAPSAGSQRTEQLPTKPATISDHVFERTPSTGGSAPPEEKKPARVSRFKQAKAAQPPPSSSVLEDRPILSSSVVERPAVPAHATAPMPKDDLDPEIQQRQLASEYYRMRNNMIRQQGGFKMTEEDRNRPLMEEREDGKVTKVSRFKAARLG